MEKDNEISQDRTTINNRAKRYKGSQLEKPTTTTKKQQTNLQEDQATLQKHKRDDEQKEAKESKRLFRVAELKTGREK